MVICETHKGFLVFLCWFVGGVVFFFCVPHWNTSLCECKCDGFCSNSIFILDTVGNHQKNQKGILEVDVKNPVFPSPYVKKGRGHQKE